MDYNALVEAIVSRVSEKITLCEQPGKLPACDKPKLLVFRQGQDEASQKLLESKDIGACFQTVCKLPEEDQVNAEEFECAILCNLTNEVMAKIAGGISDTQYIALVMKLILLGKRLYVPYEQVELFQYEAVAPAPYYAMLREKLTLLEQSGLVICCREELEDRILCNVCNPSHNGVGQSFVEAPKVKAGEELKLKKKVINERDVMSAQISGATVLHVGAKAILTDLAREYAHAKNIEIVRE